MEWIIGLLIGLFIVIAILGALAGGKSFGETLKRGFGSLLKVILFCSGAFLIWLFIMNGGLGWLAEHKWAFLSVLFVVTGIASLIVTRRDWMN
jgi:hypothetical protein